MKLCSTWHEVADLTIEEAAFLMAGVDLKMLRSLEEKGAGYGDDLYSQGIFEHVSAYAEIIMSQVRAGRIRLTHSALSSATRELSARETYISLPDFLAWCEACGRPDIAVLFPPQSAPPAHRPETAEPGPTQQERSNTHYPWVPAAQNIYHELRPSNARLNLEQMAEKVHLEMKRRNSAGQPGMSGRGGKIPAAETIKRHALNGIR
ncbi:MAG: hypothetical protein JNK92_10150 [Dechloromonas sp.]|nr:hypothetical protein [Dechloromonas sp.]